MAGFLALVGLTGNLRHNADNHNASHARQQ